MSSNLGVVSKHCVRWVRGWSLAVAFAALGLALAPTAAQAAELSAGRISVPDLEALCRPEAVQRVVADLSPTVTVEEITNGPKLPGGVQFTASKNRVAAYCQVTGTFVTNPKTGKTANFLATLPAAWNRKYLQLGCGGHCGIIIGINDPASPGITVTNQGYPGEIIDKGYAAFSTDEGHLGIGLGRWAFKEPGHGNEDAVTDFLYRADETLARVGKEFTVAFYSQATKARQRIRYSYFNGCSGGGRDAFVAASYFPQDFDGIIGGPAYSNPVGVALQLGGSVAATIRSEDADVPAWLVKEIDPIVKAKCDAADGVKDGLIQNPAACDFRPDRDLPRCDGKTARTQCFTQAEIDTVSALLSAVTDEKGNVVQPGYTVSDVMADFRPLTRPKDLTAAEPWPDVDSSPMTGSSGGFWPLAHALLTDIAHQGDPNFHLRSLFTFRAGGPGAVTDYHIVVPREEVDKDQAELRRGTGAIPQNAAELIKLNRKFLIWVDLSDQVLTPYLNINYYKKLARMYGGYQQLQRNVRLFAIPDASHCSITGVGPDNFDALTAMENWVERGNAPDALLAKLYSPEGGIIDPEATPLRTMPLCKFPEMAHYSGNGDVNDAANWSCPANDTSMLTVGESGRQAGVIQ